MNVARRSLNKGPWLAIRVSSEKEKLTHVTHLLHTTILMQQQKHSPKNRGGGGNVQGRADPTRSAPLRRYELDRHHHVHH